MSTALHSSRATLANVATLALLTAAALALLPLHDDGWMLSSRTRDAWFAGGIALAYAGACAWLAWRSRTIDTIAAAGGKAATTVVAWASQTGFAHDIARRTAALLAEAGVAHTLLPLQRLDAGVLAGTRRLLVIASTTGEGDPPDHALAFLSSDMNQRPDLSHLSCAVLALGDREYAHYCGFGHQLEQWLHACGARPLFDLTEVDNGEPAALRHWQHHVAQLYGATTQPNWEAPRYEPWALQARTLANPGSDGHEAFLVSLQPPAGARVEWQAGDIIEIGPRNAPTVVADLLGALSLRGDEAVQRDGGAMRLDDLLARSRLPAADALRGLSPQVVADTLAPLPAREYSIASLPAEGPMQLLVRRMRQADGTPGLGSGWLCDHAAIGATIDARVRTNTNFHAPDPTRPLLLLGNGTGIAGLRAHLAARVAAGARRNWLLVGERHAGRDDFFDDDLQRWHGDGWLERLDRVHSRDGHAQRYVQHALAAKFEVLRAWADDNAAIYVCGSLQGMAPAVDAVLRELLGHARVEAMLADGRYRRDVY